MNTCKTCGHQITTHRNPDGSCAATYCDCKGFRRAADTFPSPKLYERPYGKDGMLK